MPETYSELLRSRMVLFTIEMVLFTSRMVLFTIGSDKPISKLGAEQIRN